MSSVRHFIWGLLLTFTVIFVAPPMAGAASRDAQAHFERANDYFDKGDYDKAIAEYDIAIRLDPTNAQAFIGRGSAYGLKSDYDRALPDFNEALRLNPRLENALANRAVVLSQKGDDDAALVDLDQLSKVNPRNPLSFLLRATIYMERRQYDRAVAELNKGLEIDPKNTDGLVNRAESYIALKQMDRAAADFAAAIKSSPSKSNPLLLRAEFFEDQEKFDAALADLNQAVKVEPKVGRNYAKRGDIWRKKGDLDHAAADYEQAIKLDPNTPFGFQGRGLVYRARGQFPQAVQQFGEVISRYPSYLPAYLERGLADEAMRDYSAARKDYQQAATMSPLFNYADKTVDSTDEQKTAQARLALLADADKPQAPTQATATAIAPPATHVALVIGNGAYREVNRLTNPVNDARRIAQALRDIKFDVTEGEDLDYAAMQALVNGFARRAVTAQMVLIFYAGHGVQIDGRNYLLPIDISTSSAEGLAKKAVSLDTILSGLDDKTHATLVFLDACRDNPFAPEGGAKSAAAGRNLSLGPGLSAPASLGHGGMAGAGTLLAFATAPGQVALDGDDGDSPFSVALIRHIATPDLEIQSMLTRVRADVVKATNGSQIPWSNSSLLGEVYLVR
jgi:uncharacterized caspase-like protein/lipoprotein NlpI